MILCVFWFLPRLPDSACPAIWIEDMPNPKLRVSAISGQFAQREKSFLVFMNNNDDNNNDNNNNNTISLNLSASDHSHGEQGTAQSSLGHKYPLQIYTLLLGSSHTLSQ